MGQMTLIAQIEIAVDKRGWANEYGCSSSQVALDVENYILNLIQQCPAGYLLEVTGYAVHPR